MFKFRSDARQNYRMGGLWIGGLDLVRNFQNNFHAILAFSKTIIASPIILLKRWFSGKKKVWCLAIIWPPFEYLVIWIFSEVIVVNLPFFLQNFSENAVWRLNSKYHLITNVIAGAKCRIRITKIFRFHFKEDDSNVFSTNCIENDFLLSMYL